jgi:hypothetical protein
LFIFASTLIRFIESEHHEPNERLQLVLSEASGTTHEGRAGIDFLYSQVLLHAFSDVHESAVFANMRRVLGAIILAFNPLSRKALSTILGLSTTLISTTLRHLHSVIIIPADEDKEIRVFHKSFPDFLQDDKRCTDLKFHINPRTYHGVMVLRCLKLVRKLKRNPCSLPPFAMNQDSHDLPQLLENKVGGAVRYACSYWARHLMLSPRYAEFVRRVIVSVTGIFKNAPPWIEIMSLGNRLEEVIHSLNSLLDWLDKVSCSLFPSNMDINSLITLQAKARRPNPRSARPCDRLPPVYDVLFPPHPTMRTTNIPHRRASLTNLVTTAQIPPPKHYRQPAISRGCFLRSSPNMGVAPKDNRRQAKAAHMHCNFRPGDHHCV